MKKFATLLLALTSFGTAVTAADIAVNGNLTTTAAVKTNYTDFSNDGSDSQGILFVDAELNTTVELSEKVKVVLQLELNDQILDGATGSYASDSDNVDIDEAYVQVDEFFTEWLSVKIGHQYAEYSLRQNERAILIAGDFTGIVATSKVMDGDVQIDAFYLKATEDLIKGASDSDNDLYGVNVDWWLSEKNLVTANLSYADLNTGGANTDNANAITFSVGADYFLLDDALELFGELAVQFGDVNEDSSRSAFALDLGARYTFADLGSIEKLWVELSIGYRTGEDDDADDSETFWNAYSLDNGGTIAEDDYDDNSVLNGGYVNSSYLAVRLEAGADWTEKMSSEFLVAFYDNVADDADPYGVEVDLDTSYAYSENLSFSAKLAIFMPDDSLTGGGDDDAVFGAALLTNVNF